MEKLHFTKLIFRKEENDKRRFIDETKDLENTTETKVEEIK